jgi:hypothetical protein
MAALLYPVDLRSFDPPDQDESLKELVRVFQRQLQQPATGIPTRAQVSTLRRAAQDLWTAPVSADPKFVIVGESDAAVDGMQVDKQYPLLPNVVQIRCRRDLGVCTMSTASATFGPQDRSLVMGRPVEFLVTSWTAHRVSAVLEHPCGSALLTIDSKPESVSAVTVPRNDPQRCPGNARAYKNGEPDTWTLGDGLQIMLDDWNARDGLQNAVYALAAALCEPLRVG